MPDIFDFPSLDALRDNNCVVQFLAKQLQRGRLSLILGAGVSQGIGLSSWTALIDECRADLGITTPKPAEATMAAEDVFQRVGGDDVRFREVVKKALYKNFNPSPKSLLGQSALPAIGALSIASIRGGLRKIVTFNFDDVLERYLQYHGICSRSVPAIPFLTDKTDVFIYHPHGILPFGDNDNDSQIIMARTQFDRALAPNGGWSKWAERLQDILSEHYCVFYGLSGDDINLTRILEAVKDCHPRPFSIDRHWAFRICMADDSKIDYWESKGVACLKMQNWDSAAEFLQEICRVAALEHAR